MDKVKPLYRSKDWNRTERVKERERKKGTWFKGDGSEAVFFVDATPESELAKECRKEFKKSGLKVKVVERSGRSIKRTLVKSNKSCQKETNGDKISNFAITSFLNGP